MKTQKYGRIPASARKLSIKEGDFRWQVGRTTIVVWGPLVAGQGPKHLLSYSLVTGRHDPEREVAVEPHHIAAAVMRGFEPLKPQGVR